jgi:hypothetical protein
MDHSEAREERDYVDGKCYYEIVCEKTRNNEMGEFDCLSDIWIEANEFQR